MSEQGQSPVLTVYHCPKCGSESLEHYPSCLYDCHDGRNHGVVEREPIAYVPKRLLAAVQAERDHWKDANDGNFERAKQEYARAEAAEAEVERLDTARRELWECLKAAGADYSSLTGYAEPWNHMQAGKALQAVNELRKDYDDDRPDERLPKKIPNPFCVMWGHNFVTLKRLFRRRKPLTAEAFERPWPKPTDKDAERAKRIAHEQGWLTDDGFIWEHRGEGENPA